MLTKPVPLPPLRRAPSAPLRMPTLYESPRMLVGSRPVTVAGCGAVEHTGPTRYVWNLLGCLGSIGADVGRIESLPFADHQGEQFTVALQPTTDHGMLSVILGRRAVGPVVKFKLSIGGGVSGIKCLGAEAKDFEVVLDPRAVFGSSTSPPVESRVSLLKNLSVTVDYV